MKFVVLILSCLLLSPACQTGSEAPDNESKNAIEKSGLVAEVILIIDYSSTSDTLQINIADHDSLTVLNLLQTSTTNANIKLELKEYPFGVLVEQIGERTNGDGGYWLYMVNGEAIPHAASAYHIHPTDTIRFFFE